MAKKSINVIVQLIRLFQINSLRVENIYGRWLWEEKSVVIQRIPVRCHVSDNYQADFLSKHGFRLSHHSIKLFIKQIRNTDIKLQDQIKSKAMESWRSPGPPGRTKSWCFCTVPSFDRLWLFGETSPSYAGS